MPVNAAASGRRNVTLVVEDEDGVRELAAAILRESGRDVLAFASAEAALAALDDANLEVDALVTDLTLPGMDGATLAAFVRALHPRVHVVITSGSGEEVILARLSDSGRARILAKPFRLAALVEAVGKTTEG